MGEVGDELNDPFLENLNKEIAELRERRITHNLNKQRMLDDDDLEDDFEAVFFTETILGELGSSSGSHKNSAVQLDLTDEEDNKVDDDKLTYLSADSGASDRENKRVVPQPTAGESENTATTNEEEKSSSPSGEESKETIVPVPEEAKSAGLLDKEECFPGAQTEEEKQPFKNDVLNKISKAILETRLEAEISNLFSNISVKAKSIKETLKK